MIKLKYERWQTPLGGELGTIRTEPENYYVASVMANGTLEFHDIETNTKGINTPYVTKWFIRLISKNLNILKFNK